MFKCLDEFGKLYTFDSEEVGSVSECGAAILGLREWDVDVRSIADAEPIYRIVKELVAMKIKNGDDNV